ncbi:MAG: hypothetical protein FJZ64_00895 [Chlamydiae bacterium]|nr:hypothetical protein [Chlamydiota bacterium]
MELRKVLLSVLQLFATFSFFMAGLMTLCLPLMPKACTRLADLFLSSPKSLIPVGIGLVIAAFVLFAGFYYFQKDKSLRIRMQGGSALVDPKVMQKTLEEYLRKQFAHQIALSHLQVTGGSRIEICVSLSALEEGMREQLFVSLQEKIPSLLQERFAYSKPFALVVKS